MSVGSPLNAPAYIAIDTTLRQKTEVVHYLVDTLVTLPLPVRTKALLLHALLTVRPLRAVSYEAQNMARRSAATVPGVASGSRKVPGPGGPARGRPGPRLVLSGHVPSAAQLPAVPRGLRPTHHPAGRNARSVCVGGSGRGQPCREAARFPALASCQPPTSAGALVAGSSQLHSPPPRHSHRFGVNSATGHGEHEPQPYKPLWQVANVG